MNRKLFLYLVAWSSLALAQPPAKRNLHIVFIGNSITQGVGLVDALKEAPPVEACAWLSAQQGVGTVGYRNMGRSGHTTIDFLPGGKDDFRAVEEAARSFTGPPGELVFSISLGTNDSAISGPNGAPVEASAYGGNLQAIAGRLLADFPGCKLVFQRPTWYSPNTQNKGAAYLQAGLDRLQSYFPVIRAVVKSYRETYPGQVFNGDTRAFRFFKKHAAQYFQAENGVHGIFNLHPNAAGARILGDYWALAIYRDLF